MQHKERDSVWTEATFGAFIYDVLNPVGEGGSRKADEVRVVAWNSYYKSVPNADSAGGSEYFPDFIFKSPLLAFHLWLSQNFLISWPPSPLSTFSPNLLLLSYFVRFQGHPTLHHSSADADVINGSTPSSRRLITLTLWSRRRHPLACRPIGKVAVTLI